MGLTNSQPHINFISKGSGTAVVLIHGFTFSSAIWEKQITDLSKYFNIIALDLRGHGDSDKPESAYPASGFVEDVKNVLDNLRIDKAVLVGWSMGGFVARDFYYVYPDRVIGLVLVGTRGLPTLNVDEMNKEVRSIGFREHLYRRTKNAFSERTPPEVIESAFQIRLKTPEEIALRVRDSYRNFDPSKNLSEIKVPTLLIAGGEDRITSPEEAKVLHKAIEGSELEILQGCGHTVMWEAPEKFNSTIRNFVKELEP